MAIYTPRGLKIRLDTDLAFTYIARLYPTPTAFQVLKTTEAIELIPSLLSFYAGLYTIFTKSPMVDIAICVGIATLVGGILNVIGFYPIPFLVPISTAISYIYGYGLFSLAIILGSIFTVGWHAIIYFVVGRYSAFLILYLIDNIQMRYKFKKTGMAITVSERSFFNAYKYYARQLGITTSLQLNEGERESGRWILPFKKLNSDWPEITAEFTKTNN